MNPEPSIMEQLALLISNHYETHGRKADCIYLGRREQEQLRDWLIVNGYLGPGAELLPEHPEILGLPAFYVDVDTHQAVGTVTMSPESFQAIPIHQHMRKQRGIHESTG